MTNVSTISALIPVREHEGQQVASGRDIHAYLGVKTRYNDWFKRMVEYGFTEGQDYVLISESVAREGRGEVDRHDHAVTIDMAKELGMIQRTQQGKAVRQYFIEVEKQAREQAPANPYAAQIPQNYADALRAHAREVEAREAMESYAKSLEPKADAYTAFMDADGTLSVGSVAKMLGLSQNKMFALLRNHEIFISKGHMRNTPYQKYMHHFTVSAYSYERKDGTAGASYTTRVQPSGVEFIRRKLSIATVRPTLEFGESA